LGSGVQAQACLWRNSAASGLVKADWRPHSSEFSHLLIVGHDAQQHQEGEHQVHQAGREIDFGAVSLFSYFGLY
jgi:hypothetical protein